MDEDGTGLQPFTGIIIIFVVAKQVGDIGTDQEKIAFPEIRDVIANELGAFTLPDPYQFIFLVEMPGLVEIIAVPLAV